jgi:hypothetical protein
MVGDPGYCHFAERVGDTPLKRFVNETVSVAKDPSPSRSECPPPCRPILTLVVWGFKDDTDGDWEDVSSFVGLVVIESDGGGLALKRTGVRVCEVVRDAGPL